MAVYHRLTTIVEIQDCLILICDGLAPNKNYLSCDMLRAKQQYLMLWQYCILKFVEFCN